nr:cyclin-dependent kinase g-2 [Quercus suber]
MHCTFNETSDKAGVEDGLVGELNSQTDLSSSLPSVQSGDDCRQEHVEEEEFVGARNTSMSRWASDDEALDDSRRSSPDSEEIRTELSGEGRARSSSFDGDGCSVGPVSGNTYCEGELLDADSMGTDDKQDENASVSGSDADSEDDGDNHHFEETKFPSQRSTNMLQGCRSVYEFEYLKKINEGTYGVVYKAKDKKMGNCGLEEEVVMDEDDFDSVFMVMEYMESDVKGVLEAMKVKKQLYCMSEVKCLMRQLLEGVKYLHDNWVIHRDLKTSNLLLSNEGELKICDLGLSRQYGSPLKPYNPLVQST